MTIDDIIFDVRQVLSHVTNNKDTCRTQFTVQVIDGGIAEFRQSIEAKNISKIILKDKHFP
jgi:hypothetical protein